MMQPTEILLKDQINQDGSMAVFILCIPGLDGAGIFPKKRSSVETDDR